MILKTKNQIATYLAQGFEGRAVAHMPQYPYASVLQQMSELIDRKTRIVSGPLFDGEAEAFLMRPLVALAKDVLLISGSKGYVPGSIIKKAYSLACQYSVIAEIARISQAKEIADKMTAGAAQDTPVWIALKAAVATAGKETPSGTKSNYELLKEFLSQADGAAVMQSLLRPDSSATDNTSLDSSWKLLQANMRRGKGFYLAPDRRTDVIQDRAYVRMALAELLSLSETHAQRATIAADALTFAYWYLIYLQSVDEYDITFPVSPYISQSQAWVLSLRTVASKLTATFSDIAVTAFSFDIQVAMSVYESADEFYSPLIQQTSMVKDAKMLMDEAKALFNKVSNDYAVQAATTAMSSMREYTGATHILPVKYQVTLTNVLSQIKRTVEVDAAKVLSSTDATEVYEVLKSASSDIFQNLLADGQAIIDSIELIARARAILALDFDPDADFSTPLVRDMQYSRVLPIKGSIGVPANAGFEKHDALSLTIPKWTYESKSNVPKWIFFDEMFKAKFHIPLCQAKIPKSTDKENAYMIVWPAIGSIPIGDPVSAAYVRTPVPAIYTRSRNRDAVSYTMTSFLGFFRGQVDALPAAELFKSIANLIAQHPTIYQSIIANYFASTMFIYEQTSEGLVHCKPTIPAIYGMPLAAMIEKNGIKTVAQLSSRSDKDTAVTVTVIGADGVRRNFAFVLHDYYPVIKNTSPVAFSPTRGVVISVPVYKEAVNLASIDEKTTTGDVKTRKTITSDLIATMKESEIGYDPKNIWLEPFGWFPGLITLPHLLFDVQTTSSLVQSEEYFKLAITSISKKVSTVTGDIRIGGFSNNPIVVMDLQDYSDAITQPDPTPIQDSEIVDETSIMGGKESKGAPSGGASPEAKMLQNSVSQSEQAKNAATVTQSPILETKPDQKIVTIEDAKIPDDTRIPGADKTPAAGSPLPGAQEATTGTEKQPEGQKSEPQKKYFKKLNSDGEVEDVIEVDGADAAPSGYVPATAEEYAEFKKNGKSNN